MTTVELTVTSPKNGIKVNGDSAHLGGGIVQGGVINHG